MAIRKLKIAHVTNIILQLDNAGIEATRPSRDSFKTPTFLFIRQMFTED